MLRGVDLDIRRGELIGLVGTTGAGKSTLCLTFNGLVPHYTGGTFEGSVEIDGLDTRRLTVADLSARVGLVFQDADAQLIMSTVEEECQLGPLSHGASRAEARAAAAEMLALLEISHLASRPASTLSGGQKQRAAIAAVMATSPEVLVLDEATSELDALMVHKLFAICDRLNRDRGTTIVIVSHEIELLAQHTGRIVLFHDGRVALDGPPAEVFRDRAAFARAGVRLPQVAQVAAGLEGSVPFGAPPLTEEAAASVLREALRGRASRQSGRPIPSAGPE